MKSLESIVYASFAVALCLSTVAACKKDVPQANGQLKTDEPSSRVMPDPRKNEYPGFDAQKEPYTSYAIRMMNDPLLRMDRIPDFISQRLSPGNGDITLLNPHQKLDITFQAADGQVITYQDVEVGANKGPGFECMGACGGGCPASGIPMGFTKDCLIHDYCVLKFGIKEEKRADHPECGKLFTLAEDDFMKYGHLRQGK